MTFLDFKLIQNTKECFINIVLSILICVSVIGTIFIYVQNLTLIMVAEIVVNLSMNMQDTVKRNGKYRFSRNILYIVFKRKAGKRKTYKNMKRPDRCWNRKRLL